MKRKKWLIASATLFLLISAMAVYSQTSNSNSGNSQSDFGIFQPLGSIFSPIVNLFIQAGSLEGDSLVGFTRFIIWIVVFTVIYGGLKAANLPWMKNNIAIVLALGFSIISAVFMPNEWILQIGSSWAEVAFLLMVGLILGAILWFAISQWNKPLLSAPLWFISLSLISYFNQVFGVARPKGNVVVIPGLEDSAGILHVVFQVAGAVAAIAFLIQFVRAIISLFGGGNLEGTRPNFGGLFGGNQPAHDDRGGNHGNRQHGNGGNGGGGNGGNGGGGGDGGNHQPLQVHIRGPVNGYHAQLNTPVRFIIEATGGHFNITVNSRATLNGVAHPINHNVIHNDPQRAFDFSHSFNQPGNYVVDVVAEDSQGNTAPASIVVIVGQRGQFALNIAHPTNGQPYPANQPMPFEGNVTGGAFPIQLGIQVTNRQNNQIIPIHNGIIHNNVQRTFTHNHALPAGHYRAAFLAHEHGGGQTGDQVNFDVVQGPGQQLAIHIVHPTTGHPYTINQQVPFEATLNSGNIPINWVLNIVDRNSNQPVIQPHQEQGQRHFTHNQQLPAGQYRAVFIAQENGQRGVSERVDFDVGTIQQFGIDVRAPNDGQHFPAGQQFAIHAEIIGGPRPVRWAVVDTTTNAVLGAHQQWINQQGNVPIGPFNSPNNLAQGQHVIRFVAEAQHHPPIHVDRTVFIDGHNPPPNPRTPPNFQVHVNNGQQRGNTVTTTDLVTNTNSRISVENAGGGQVSWIAVSDDPGGLSIAPPGSTLNGGQRIAVNIVKTPNYRFRRMYVEVKIYRLTGANAPRQIARNLDTTVKYKVR